MNKFNKILGLILLINSMSVFSANDKSTLLMSEAKGGYELDFLNNDGITAIQFDVTLSGATMNKSSIGSCVTGLPKSHTGSCTIQKNGNVRVIVFSTSNAVLDSGNIGSIRLDTNKVSNVSINKVLMGTPDMKEINGSVLIDVKGKDRSLSGISNK